MNLFIESLRGNNQEGLKYYSKLIALSVRNELEDLHSNYIPNGKMKEFNTLIRKGIYDALFVLVNEHRDDFFKQFANRLKRQLPDTWEDPELEELLETKRLELEHKTDITFQSDFLNAQFACGNIYYNKISGGVHIKNSFEFIGVEGNAHKHRDKISRLLTKEGYRYQSGSFAYIKMTSSLF